ncbi:ABC transporter ATP-binding protein [Halegenticoccus tardaugens]|uniref:ABC transporter ATP-binding protein n=1 Tax=Halegenticoccus tardaugens TaxID=2071624 RepID=UPI00100C288C|nr:ABC transporter ATP-binding protein [Halegenticoccus tardaugens]
MARIHVDDLRKEYSSGGEAVVAVEAFDVTVDDGEFLVLVGPSGCGKTTTLRCVAGLEDVTDGRIRFGDRDVTDRRARNRDVAMVFQNYALYPHMNVRENMGFGLKLSTDMPAAEIDDRVRATAEMMGIEDLLDDKPKELSGGQQQRVALGRAIVREPAVFLMDEPLSNLDAKLRSEMRTELQELQHDLGVTTVYVTHDQTEAMAMGDRIAVMNDGTLQQVGDPEEVYRSPANEFVADFIGSPSINLFTAEAEGSTLRGPGGFAYELDDPAVAAGYDRLRVGVRPEDVELVEVGGNEATVTVTEHMGNENVLYLEMGGEELTARIDSAVRPSPDETVRFDFDGSALYLFDPSTGEAVKTKTDELGVSVTETR